MLLLESSIKSLVKKLSKLGETTHTREGNMITITHKIAGITLSTVTFDVSCRNGCK